MGGDGGQQGRKEVTVTSEGEHAKQAPSWEDFLWRRRMTLLRAEPLKRQL